MRTRLILLLFPLTVLFAGAAAAAGEFSPQISSAAGVKISAKPQMGSGGVWEFSISLDTHSQELNDDLVNVATLLAGGKTFTPAAWQGDPPGGHHRKGVLKFNAVEPSPQTIELRIRRSGESKPRSFRWQVR